MTQTSSPKWLMILLHFTWTYLPYVRRQRWLGGYNDVCNCIIYNFIYRFTRIIKYNNISNTSRVERVRRPNARCGSLIETWFGTLWQSRTIFGHSPGCFFTFEFYVMLFYSLISRILCCVPCGRQKYRTRLACRRQYEPINGHMHRHFCIRLHWSQRSVSIPSFLSLFLPNEHKSRKMLQRRWWISFFCFNIT